MCSSHKCHRVCTVGLCAMGRCVLVHFVVGGFGLAGLPWPCWEGSVVDCLPAVGYCLGYGTSYFELSLIDCWGQAGWDSFVVQTLVPMEQVEQGWGLELVALVLHSIFVGVVVPLMWEFATHTIVLAKPWPKSAAVVQVVHRQLLLRTGTSFLHSLEFGFGKQH